ncbi:NADP-dependent oxidoreductase [Nocardioides speluncae]|uniref:NADP-dependent oxidoreductase n=1 Tax=Nocardioides speluncae TaxID=2670337 RepID=UPI000D69D409|nr:NADP-dependent oxidoreductase [Nocardioides speluncae]
MRAIVIRTPGGPEALELVDLPTPEPGPGEVRIAVAAAAVNPVDISVRDGIFHQLGFITQPEHVGLGWDVAGTIAAVGADVPFRVGDRVAAMVGGVDRSFGPYAEELVLPATEVASLPDGLDLVEAATVPLNTLTATQALDLLGDAEGRTLLVTGAAGAVGGYAVQLAAERGWQVTGLARPSDEAFVRERGAAFASEIDGSFDAVLDPASLVEPAIAAVRDGGVYIGVLPAMKPTTDRDVTIDAVQVQVDAATLAGLLARTAAGELPARVHSTLPLDQAADAHRLLSKGGVRGRIVLVP